MAKDQANNAILFFEKGKNSIDETKILLDMHKLLLKDIEKMKEQEPNVNMKWLKFMFKKMPLLFPIILDSYFNAMITHCLNGLLPF